MPLAYTIEDMHKAHYVLMNIESNEGVISELESLFKFNDSIMRHLIVKMKKAETGDSKLFELNNKKDDSKKGPEPLAYKLGKVQLINSTTIEINIPDIEKESLLNRTDENGNISVNAPICLEYKLKSKNGSTIEQTIYATINSLPEEKIKIE